MALQHEERHGPQARPNPSPLCVHSVALKEQKGRKGGKDKGKGKDVGKGKEKGRGSYTFTIDVDNVDTSFGMLAKLVGINGENVHRIQDVTKAKVWINREAGQPTAMSVTTKTFPIFHQMVAQE